MSAENSTAIAVNSGIMDLTELKDVSFPTYQRQALTPGILHIGVGAFHRAHQAHYIDQLCQHHRTTQWAIRGVGIMPQDEVLSASLHRQD